MSTFAGGAEKRAVMDGFTWGQKVAVDVVFSACLPAEEVF